MDAFHMIRAALVWYKWMFPNHQLTDWNTFYRTLALQFCQPTYENNQAQLFKLKEHASFSKYQAILKNWESGY